MRGAVRWLPPVVDVALLVGLFLAMAGASNPPLVGELRTAATASPTSAVLPVTELTVTPPSFWMRTGENVSLQAVWSTGTPLCTVAPLWYRWSLEEGPATGYLNGSTGSATTFTADSFDSGNVSVGVRAGAVLNCGPNATVVERSEEARVTVVVPLALAGVDVGPNPLPPGGTATLQGSVTGGVPPYALEVAWGDGTYSVVHRSTPGAFTVNHTFATGEFVPYVGVEDSEGDLENRSVAEALSVGSGLEAAVIPASYVAEVGVPVDFVGVDQDPPPGAVTIFDCTNATVGPSSSPPQPNASAFSCVFHAPGTAEVLFGIYPPAPGGVSASALLYEAVVPPPEVGVEPVESIGEVGSSALVRVSLTGGALPVAIAWNLTGNRSGGSETVASDGGGVLALPLAQAGEYALGIRASDALGGVGGNDSLTLKVDPTLEARASGASSIDAGGALAQVAGDVLTGCPPFSWWAVPSISAENGSTINGSLGTVGGFSWNATYGREGNLAVSVGVADACGALWQTGLELPLVPLLEVEFAAAPGPSATNETFAVNLSIEGGWSPFHLLVNASDHESWNRTFLSAGTYNCWFTTRANGSLALVASVSDSLGGSAEADLTVLLSPEDTPPPPPSSGSSGAPTNSSAPSATDALGLAASFGLPAGVAAGVAILWRRRSRRGAAKPVAPDPEAVLKKIIAPAEGAERFTVELLAEEAGIELAVVRSTIDRLVAQGTVRSESGADGEEVLSWSSESGR